ncbi:unnamed protein product, partial [Rotaria sp. Silwood2]
FLFENNLLPDIRLLLINELASKKFNLKFISINYINEFFRQIQNILSSSEVSRINIQVKFFLQ